MENEIGSMPDLRDPSLTVSLKNETSTKKKTKRKTFGPPIVINILNCKYQIIKDVAKEEMGWKLSTQENDHWDILWNDMPI